MWKFLLFFSVVWAVSVSESSKNHLLGKTKGSCNTTLPAHENGSFKPNNATNSTSGFFCYWKIEPFSKSESISLFFNYLFLEENDEVNVYHDANNETVIGPPLLLNPIKAQNGSVTVVTGLKEVAVTFKGNNPNFVREFEVYYAHGCLSPVPADVEILHSPIYAVNASETECTYHFNVIQHKRVQQVFTFKEFNMSNSVVNIDGSTLDGQYTGVEPSDFFLAKDKEPMSVTVKKNVNPTDYFILQTHIVDSECSGERIVGSFPVILKSPKEVLNNGTIVAECLWLVKHNDPNKVLGLKFDTMDFHSVLDIVAVNDGLSEISSPLLQVTTSNRNISQSQMIRSGKSPHFWISFKPSTYASRFAANVTFHTEGGYVKNNGTIKMTSAGGNDTVFLLEVKDKEIVMLTFDDSSFAPPASLSIYDGFDTSNLLTTLHGQIKFPILSRSSRMMIVGTHFIGGQNQFTANFRGVDPGCDHMSTLSTENYILSENCNSTCTWVISPQDTPDSESIIYLQYISLNEGDQLEIHQLDASLTQLGVVYANTTHVPHLAVPANVGALIKVTQGACKAVKDKVVLIGHSSVIPGCNRNLNPKPSEEFQISSPLFPDTYPLYTTCQWNISVSKDSLVHMTFLSLNLAENHCVRIFQNSSKTKSEYDGKILPDDLIVKGDVVVQFDSTKCNPKKVGQSLNSDAGFLLNVTVADCGSVLNSNKSGEFNTNITGNGTVCIWKVDVNESGSVNVISYSVSKKDKLENYELIVYDGATVRDSEIDNTTSPDLWSRSSVLIFVYRRLNISLPSSVLLVKYNSIKCNSTCDNKLCMHPDWRCNGKNDCGDYSDERDCKSGPVPSPVPPEVKFTGYSGVAFWLCVIAMLIIGVVLGLIAPVCYQKYKDSRYTRFRELSGIDG